MSKQKPEDGDRELNSSIEEEGRDKKVEKTIETHLSISSWAAELEFPLLAEGSAFATSGSSFMPVIS